MSKLQDLTTHYSIHIKNAASYAFSLAQHKKESRSISMKTVNK